MDNEEKGVSVAEIFKVIFRRVWWVVGVTVACLLAFVLVIQFWYNRENQTYSVNYTIYFPGIETGTYPDGTPFRYSNVVSGEALKSVAASDELLSDLDVDGMVRADDIHISPLTVTSDSGVETVVDRSYTLSVKVKYFKSGEQAVAFLRAVTEYPLTRAKEIISGTASEGYIDIYNGAGTFEDKIQALADQRDYLVEAYDDMISSVSAEYVVDGRTLSDYRLKVSAAFSADDEDYLLSRLSTGNYVLDYERFSETAEAQLSSLTQQKANNQARIEALREERDAALSAGNAVSVESFNAIIARLVNANVDIEQEMAEINGKLEWIESAGRDEDIAAFTAELDACRDALVGQIEVFKAVSEKYYDAMCDITYSNNTISPEGGINIILAAAIGAVLGFIIVSVIICIVDMPGYLKRRNAAQSGECLPGREDEEQNEEEPDEEREN